MAPKKNKRIYMEKHNNYIYLIVDKKEYLRNKLTGELTLLENEFDVSKGVIIPFIRTRNGTEYKFATKQINELKKYYQLKLDIYNKNIAFASMVERIGTLLDTTELDNNSINKITEWQESILNNLNFIENKISDSYRKRI